MTTTVADLSIFCQSILGAENCPALLTPESVALMTSTQVNRPLHNCYRHFISNSDRFPLCSS
jgi:hypothetical protein